jgi:hypothetical protein
MTEYVVSHYLTLSMAIHSSAHAGHLQSEAKNVLNIKCSDIEVIDEKGHEGELVFLPRGLFELESLLICM